LTKKFLFSFQIAVEQSKNGREDTKLQHKRHICLMFTAIDPAQLMTA